MNELFLTLLNRSLAAGWLILALIILRPFLRRVSRTLCCALWGLVAFRLLCPFSIQSVLSLIPNVTTIPTDLTASGEGISAGTQVSGDLLASAPPTIESVASAAISPAQTILRIVVVMWITGVALFALYALLSYMRMYLYVRFSARQDGYWVCDRIKAPFVLGVFRPRIYLPLSVNPYDVPYILAHERAHLTRRDHWRKPIAYVLLAIFWFQPLMWVAFILLCRDVEFACDERALRALGVDVQSKKAYAEALLRSTNPRTPAIACPLAFGGLQVKQRVHSVVKYRKPAAIRVLAALLVCAVVAICFLTDPKVGADTFADISEALVDETSQTDGTVGNIPVKTPINEPSEPTRNSEVEVLTRILETRLSNESRTEFDERNRHAESMLAAGDTMRYCYSYFISALSVDGETVTAIFQNLGNLDGTVTLLTNPKSPTEGIALVTITVPAGETVAYTLDPAHEYDTTPYYVIGLSYGDTSWRDPQYFE